MSPAYRVLMIIVAFLIIGWGLRITVFDQHLSIVMSLGGSGNGSRIQHWTDFPHNNNSDMEDHVSFPENVWKTKGRTGDIPTTLLAAGDIAKCDGEDPWQKKFLTLVRILPDDGPPEPFLENLLELLSLSEETDYPAHAAMTARLVLRLPGRVLALGDLVYPTGTTQQFQECYESTWGQFKARTHPVPGNHEYKEKDAAPYFTYWANRAGEAKKGYYSFDLGEWHIIGLNSQLEPKDTKDSISTQQEWLQNDLAATHAKCILAYWHHPVFSSGQHGGTSRMKNILQTLYEAGTSVVVTAHDHHYERFALQNPAGVLDPSHGFRNFVVGTGGRSLRPLNRRHENSEAFRADSFGVLRLDLYSNYYQWQFLPVGEGQPYDVGTGTCVTQSRPEALFYSSSESQDTI